MMSRIPAPSLRQDDCGDILLGWLIKLVVSLGLVAVVCYDAISIGATSAAVSDQGVSAARAGATSWRSTGDVELAYDASVAAAQEANRLNRVDPRHFRIEPDGTVYLRIERVAQTLVVRHVGPLAHWAQISHDESGGSSE